MDSGYVYCWPHKRLFKDKVDTPIDCAGYSGEAQEEDRKPMAAWGLFR